LDLQGIEHDDDLMRTELARSEAERSRAESALERLQRAHNAQLRALTEATINLARAEAGEAEAQQTVRLAVAEIAAVRDLWVRTHLQLERERELGRGHAHALNGAIRRAEELEAIRVERDSLREQLDAITASRSWKLSRPIRVAARVVRRIRATVV